MNNIRLISSICALGLGLAGALSAASANDVVTKISIKVQPYELETAGGRATVIRRIEMAARRLCTDPGVLRSADTGRSECIASTTGSMVGQVGSVELLAQWKGDRPIRTTSRI